MTDRELLAEFATKGSPGAFAGIMERYAGLVYATCLRALGDAHAAEDATQATFLVLMSKAGKLSGGTVLSGWLYLTAQAVARNARRQAARRQRLEREAAAMKAAASDAGALGRELQPHLDAALAALPAAQRDPIILRYVRGLSEAEIGRELDCPQSTVAMRISRGLERLRGLLGRRGVGVPAAALGALLGEQMIQPVPAGLAAVLGGLCAGAAKASASAASLAEGTMKAMFWAKIKLVAGVVTASAVLGAGGIAAVKELAAPELKAVPADAEAGTPILEAGSYWRVHAACRDAVVPLDLLKEKSPNATEPRLLPMQTGKGMFGRLSTPPPAAGWTQPDFDDSAWFRSPGPLGGYHRGWYNANGLMGLYSLRGKFAVNDPAGVRNLTLTVGYRGGAVVYLNGTEVCRQDLPEGALTPATPGAAYPKEVYVDAAGKIITGRDKAALDQAERKRNRRLGPVTLPAKLLRKGLNVLAIEIHRSDFRPEALLPEWNHDPSWAHIELNALKLAADAAPGAILPNLSRPREFQVWSQDVVRLFDAADYGDPNEPLRAVRLAGARNGCYSGQVVCGSTAAIKDLKTAVSDLVQEGGTGKIPASAVTVRYPAFPQRIIGVPGTGSDLSQHLDVYRTKPKPFWSHEVAPPASVEPVAGAAVQPVWIDLRVPKDAPAGRYAGALTISASGAAPVKVPLDVEVLDWTLPDTKDFRTYLGVYQSPETLAEYYKVPLWSDQHWALMEKSWQLLGELGGKILVIPLINRTQFGNQESYVPWIRKADGSYDYDFSVFDRLVDLGLKHCRPQVVSVQVWNCFCGGYHTDVDNANKPTFVTVADKETGKREAMQLPPYGSEEAKKLWKPLLDAVMSRLRQKGLEKQVVLGITSDNWIPEVYPVSRMFNELLPGVCWHSGAHNRMGGPDGRQGDKMRWACREYMYVPNYLPDPRTERRLGWQNPVLAAISQRLWEPMQPPDLIRTMPERGLLMGDNGAGRMGLDYWRILDRKSVANAPVPGKYPDSAVTKMRGLDISDRDFPLYGRFPETTSGQRNPNYYTLAAPGRDGPVPTIMTALMREGVQECEARIFIEEALANKRIAGELAAKCQTILDERADFCRLIHAIHGWAISQQPRVTVGGGYQKRAEDLYRTAAEVAKVVGGKQL